MGYSSHFRHADDVVAHLNSTVPQVTDPLLQIKYVGFVSIVAVTVYEMAIKQIFIDFAKQKNSVFGNYVEAYFYRINGRIKLSVIKDDYIKKFGDKYNKRFIKRLEQDSKAYLQTNRRDIQSSYHNLITWRNDFAHEGKINSTTTYNEAVQAYEDGKEIIHCLAKTMRY